METSQPGTPRLLRQCAKNRFWYPVERDLMSWKHDVEKSEILDVDGNLFRGYGGAMTFCCDAFASNFEMAGSRGFGIFSVQFEKDQVAFIVQCRATEAGTEAPISNSPISLISEMHIRYCPSCGKQLDRFYGTDPSIMRPDLKLS